VQNYAFSRFAINYFHSMNMFGARILRLRSVDSTSNYVAKAIDRGEYTEGTVILAHFQTEGRGQRGSVWQSSEGANLTFSFALDIGFLPLHQQFLVAKAISLGVSDYLQSIFGQEVWIKWPNDILLDHAKISGMLIEMKGTVPRYAIVGIGLNVNEKDFPSEFKATSLALEFGLELMPGEVLRDLIGFLGNRIAQLRAGDNASIRTAYMNRLFGHQSWVEFAAAGRTFQGSITDVDDSGVLITRSRQGGAYSFRAKEVTIRY
jgi:BirA family biotin operon repressor/biotin-[acetyl-CoA-carboxylase] ligase